MVWIIIGIFLTLFIALAALVRSLRLENKQKFILVIFSLVSIVLPVVTLIIVLNPNSTKTLIRIFFYSGLGISIATLTVAVYLLQRLHNKIFTDKTKEHKESVAKILAKEKEENK